MNHRSRHLATVVAATLFAPIVIIYAIGIIGLDPAILFDHIPGFGMWFMTTLAVCSAIAAVSFTRTWINSGHRSYIPVAIVMTSASIGFAFIALRSIAQ